MMQAICSAIRLLLKYKFTVLFTVYSFFIIGLPVYFTGGIILWLHIVPILLGLYVIAHTKSYGILDVLFVFVIGFNAYFSFIFKSVLTLGFLGSILETDMQESTSMMKELGLPILLITIVTFVLVWGSIRELKQLSISRKYPLLLIGLYSFVFLPYTCQRVLKSSGLIHFMDRNPIFVWQRLINTHAPIFYGNLAVVASYGNEIFEFQKYKNMERAMPDGIEYQPQKDVVEKVYLILGESSWRNHYSLYGYDTKTTPFLDSLSSCQSSTLNFYDGISPGAITRNAIPMILTFATPNDFTLYYKQKTVLDLANMQNYETVWISNQSKIDDDDSMGGSSISQIASSSSAWYLSDIPFSEDFDLIDNLKAVRKENTKQFFVLHLSGSHMSYYNKYDEIDAKAIDGDDGDVLAYDRSIHHTDRFLRKVYNIMKDDESAVVYYLSDHGEIISFGHGVCTDKSEFEVPVVTINNCNLALDSIMNKYVDRETSLFNTGNSIYVLAELMGYSVADSIVSQVVNNTSVVIVDRTTTRSYQDFK